MATALDLKTEGWDHYIEKLSKRPPKPDLSPEQREERKSLLVRVQDAAKMLKSRYGVRRVVLFGSVAHESWFVSSSDVDLAVEGLQGKAYWRAWRDVEEIIGDRPVDFIEIEAAGESLKRSIDGQGIEI